MQKREGRSFASPSSRPHQPEPGCTGRKRWERLDVSRSLAPVRVPLLPSAAIVTDIDEPEDADADDVFGLLSVEARRDVRTGCGGGSL